MSRDTTLPILVGNHIQTMTNHITSNNRLAKAIAVIASSNELHYLQYWSQLPPPQKRLSKGMRNLNHSSNSPIHAQNATRKDRGNGTQHFLHT